MNGRLQQYLTPALLGAGLIALGWLISDVRELRRDIGAVLLKVEGHDMALRLGGLLAEPSTARARAK